MADSTSTKAVFLSHLVSMLIRSLYKLYTRKKLVQAGLLTYVYEVENTRQLFCGNSGGAAPVKPKRAAACSRIAAAYYRSVGFLRFTCEEAFIVFFLIFIC